jgi:superfamily I DNA/RNA helicase
MDFKPFDVILIDEGQDFSREWILNLYELASKDNAHVMLFEDVRQNIYGIDAEARGKVPGIIGAPSKLNRSFRINREVAAVANRLIALSSRKFESGELVSESPKQADLFRPVWYEGAADCLLASLIQEINRLTSSPRADAFADIVILVCNVRDGWAICEKLDELKLPYICNFESQKENERVRILYQGEEQERRLHDLRRGRKLAFRMQTGRIKICTIHSFKGWELRRVLVFFNPSENQFKDRVPLLYTAITRTQELLTVFNAEPTLNVFGRLASDEKLVALRSPQVVMDSDKAVFPD